jgi:hypothetical protein
MRRAAEAGFLCDDCAAREFDVIGMRSEGKQRQ